MAFGSEVGTGHVSIFPSMKGFRSAVDKEMREAGKSGSNRFSQAFGNGSKIGKSVSYTHLTLPTTERV